MVKNTTHHENYLPWPKAARDQRVRLAALGALRGVLQRRERGALATRCRAWRDNVLVGRVQDAARLADAHQDEVDGFNSSSPSPTRSL